MHGLILAAIGLILCEDAVISDVSIKCLRNEAGVCSGLSFYVCKNVISRRIHISNLKTGLLANDNAPGHTCIGIVPFMCTHLIFESCQIKNISGSCDDARGISLFVVDHAKVSDCQVKHVLDGRGCKGAKATGIEIYGRRGVDAQIEVTNCTAVNIAAINLGDRQAAVFSVAGLNVKFENCHAQDVTVFDGHNQPNVKVGLGVGFGWAPDIREVYIYPAVNVLYQNCSAKDCQVGFDTFNHQYSTFCPIQAGDNKIPVLKERGNTRFLYCDECSECPDGPKVVPVKNMVTGNKFCC